MECKNKDKEYIRLLTLIKGLSCSTDEDGARLLLLMKAVTYMPERLEAIYYVLSVFYGRGDHATAYRIGKMASSNRENKSFLAYESSIYDYRFDMNFSVSAWNVGEYLDAYYHGNLVKTRGRCPPGNDADTIDRNLVYFSAKANPKDLPITIDPQNTTPTLIVIDSFLHNPDEVRAFALKQEFSVKGNYPGLRTKALATDEHKRRFESILGRKITYYPLDNYNGSFQITTGKNESWIHTDRTDYSVLVFLTPNPPPESGTILYRHKATGVERFYGDDNPDLEYRDESKWEKVDVVGNKYNRAIFFQGKMMHRSNQYFGNDLSDGRLFQVFFFNIEGRTH